MTEIKFLINNDSDVYAFFPKIKEGNDYFLSYEHIGQHSGCSIEFVNESKEAKYSDYVDLLKELINLVGYKNINVLNTQEIEYHRSPTKSEIKFGHGSTHYKSFNALAFLKKNGEIKKWLKCPIDNLKYYR
jgi:hypothetical protein